MGKNGQNGDPFEGGGEINLSEGPFSRVTELVLHLFWPVSCPVCGKAATPACGTCLDRLARYPLREMCLECMGVYPCPNHPGSVPVRSHTVFRDLPRDLVHLVKYGSRRELGRLMGRSMGRTFGAIDNAFLVPVPLHAGSPRVYNQSLELARGIADVWNAEAGERLEWRIARPTQVGLASGERKKLPRDAICWKGKVPRGKSICLVDDVVTTGATLRSCLEAVKSSGEEVLEVLTWAAV
ncbi:MAG TPA: ComF family protein [Synergistetes bacterium]|nr:ComF family protein [Synergistota bacterium]